MAYKNLGDYEEYDDHISILEGDLYMGAPQHPNDRQRVMTLQLCNILDTKSEPAYDEVTQFVQKFMDVPIVAISLVDADRQWFKSITGLNAQETPRNQAFCGFAILNPQEPFIVNDAVFDKRFANNPLVTSEPYIRFYAGFPLVLSDGQAMGTLCAIDYKPRQITEIQIDTMKMMAKYISSLMDNRRASQEWLVIDD